jgi:hypothetical protein
VSEDIELYCHTDEDGNLLIQNRSLMDEFCKRFPGKQWILKIVRRRAKRSHPQNRYYWGVVVHSIRMGLLELGHDLNKDEVHGFLKQKFNAVQVVNKDGWAEDIPGSTATLNKVQFGEYLEKIFQWSAEYLSISIPSPDEKLTLL